MKIYTKIGDKGTTKTAMGKEVAKDDCLIEANGTIDELMSSLDKVVYGLDILPGTEYDFSTILNILQRLRYLGGEISGNKQKFKITDKDVKFLEDRIDALNIDLNEFVRFENPVAMDIDESRVRTRKIERVLTEYLRNFEISDAAYKYINRLSDYLFVLAVTIDNKFE